MKRKMMDRLIEWKKKPDRQPLLLKGVRQVGKTFLLKEFGTLHFPRFHYFNFEKNSALGKIFEPDLDPKRIINELNLFVEHPINIKEDLVIFDEIQEFPKALTSLKYFQEECPELHLCGAGSLLGISLSPISFPVGKVTFETLHPMSFEEFLIAKGDKALAYLQNLNVNKKIPEVFHDHLWEELKRYFITGGLPEVVAIFLQNKENLAQAFFKVRKKQEDILNSYYADIAKHSGKVNAMHIDRIFRSIATQLSQVQDGSIQRFKFKGVVPGISHYDRLVGALDWLEGAGLVLKVSIVNTGHLPFKGYTKENFFKLLLFDVGILGCMCDLPPKVILDYDFGSYKGYFAENFVAQQLVAQEIGKLYSWQEQKAEVEFLLEIDGQAVPIEVKSGLAIKAKSLKVFASKYHPLLQVIFSARPMSFSKENHLFYAPLYFAGQPLDLIE